MEKCVHRRNVIFGVVKTHDNIVKIRPSNVNRGNNNAIAIGPNHA